jgi:teichuronic acid exporter
MSLYKKAILNSIGVSGINYVVYFINIGAQILLARFLFPEDYGIFLLALSIVEIISVIVFPELSSACIYYQKNKKVFHTAYFMSIIFFIFAIIISLLLLYSFYNYIDTTTIHLLIILIVFKFLYKVFTIYSTYIEKDINFIKLSIYKAFSRIIAIGIGVLLAYNGHSYDSLLAIEVINISLMIISFYYLSPLQVNKKYFDYTLVMPILFYSLKMLHNRLLEILIHRIPTLLIEVITGNKQIIGLFDRANYITGMPSTVTAPFHTKIVFVLFGKIKHNSEQLIKSLEWSLWFLLRIVTPMAVLTYLYTYEIVNFIFGENWIGMVDILKPLSLYMVTLLLFNVTKQIFFALNFTGIIIKMQYIFLLFLLFAFLSIWKFDYNWITLSYAYGLGSLFTIFFIFYKLSALYTINYKFIFLFPIVFILFILLAKINNILLFVLIYFIFLFIFDYKNILYIYSKIRNII